MFICSECGTKYKIMPKFCDCGNDIFTQEPEQDTQTVEIQTEQPRKRTGRGKVEALSPVTIGAFVLCLILSIVVLFFIGNPKKDIITEETDQSQKIEEKINIPAIDSFWDNTVAKVEQKEEIKEEQKEKPITDIMPKFVQNILPQEPKKEQTPVVNKPVSTTKTAAPKTTPAAKTPAKATQQTAQKTTTTPKTTPNTQTQTPNTQAQSITNRIKNNIQYNSPTTTAQNSQPSAAKTTNTQTVPAQTQTSPTTQTTSPNATPTINNNPAPTTTAVTNPAPVVKTKTRAELTKELNTYKASLRNTIGRKIDFTKVIGDGDCALTFKINSNGRLSSKAFTKQSSNITLNDAVFTALNSTTSYNPPPEGYKGEALTLKIKFYNGNFEITLN